ncbi:hypothetical protein H6G97_34150 [Nostoc flagelliforme FACHB-838]|uniref:Uncharacterized protein n=1 Tax=Nostoc flagelliforme FACHB-838 TaxID=2692904 RepID=A0ABR8DYK0_9NOSO|nr:hypothetical protein [Nostoc flagelliforme]MBD2534293.1 hypothetical protein [Nostoc flagelliforme FACHB-838]
MNTLLLQAQITLLHLFLLCSESEVREIELIVPPAASMPALRGLALHKKFGGGRNLTLAEAIAHKKSLTLEDINTMVDFFDKFKPDMTDPGWYNPDRPSVDWIRWSLMGGQSGKSWSIDTKKMLEKGLKDKSIKIKTPE